MKNDGETDDGMFMNLPNELVWHIYSFFDIGSLGKMAQMNSGRLSNYALSDDTWGSLVYRRFCVNPKQSQAREHGGTLWKDVFRSMFLTNHVPTCQYTCTPKAIVAQGGGGDHRDQVSSWVLNTKSGAGSVSIDLLGATFEGFFGGIPMDGKPLILYRSTQDIPKVDVHSLDDALLVLRPFEFCVIAMTFHCGYAELETDVLKHARSLRVPLVSSDEVIKATFIPANDIWKYYMILPGGYLVLRDVEVLQYGILERRNESSGMHQLSSYRKEADSNPIGAYSESSDGSFGTTADDDDSPQETTIP